MVVFEMLTLVPIQTCFYIIVFGLISNDANTDVIIVNNIWYISNALTSKCLSKLCLASLYLVAFEMLTQYTGINEDQFA